MPQKPKAKEQKHERIEETDALAKLQTAMLAKNPEEKEKSENEVPKRLIADLKRQRSRLGPIHSMQEALGHISATVKELEMAIAVKDTGAAKRAIRKIACVALCSETLEKGDG